MTHNEAMPAKLSFASVCKHDGSMSYELSAPAGTPPQYNCARKCVPKCNLGTRGRIKIKNEIKIKTSTDPKHPKTPIRENCSVHEAVLYAGRAGDSSWI